MFCSYFLSAKLKGKMIDSNFFLVFCLGLFGHQAVFRTNWGRCPDLCPK